MLWLIYLFVQDQGKPARAATANLQVDVTDSDDLNPKFTRDVYRTQITEFYPITVSTHSSNTSTEQFKLYS